MLWIISKLNYISDPLPYGSGEAKSATTLRSKLNKISKSDIGILEKICIFSKRSRKTFKFRWETLRIVTPNKFEQSIKDVIQRSEDETMDRQLSNIDFAAKEVCYLSKWKRDFDYDCKIKGNSDPTQIVYENLYRHIDQNVVKTKKAMSRDQIYEEFSQICTEHISDMTYEVPFKRPVIMKVHEKYGDRIQIYSHTVAMIHS